MELNFRRERKNVTRRKRLQARLLRFLRYVIFHVCSWIDSPFCYFEQTRDSPCGLTRFVPQPEIARSHRSLASSQEEGKSSGPSPSLRTGLLRRLTEEMKFEPELATMCIECGVADHLVRLKDTGVEICEDDPVLFMVVDINNAASIGFANSGNYGLPPSHPGFLPWPTGQAPTDLGHGVVSLAPGGLGKYIASLPGVSERSDGNNCVFFLPDWKILDDVRKAVTAQPQFAMYGPSIAPRLNQRSVQERDCPVKFFTLTRLDAKPNACEIYYVA